MSSDTGPMTPMGRRERRRYATLRAIQLAALRLAVERGLDNMTVRDISDAADIAPRTFFTYFSSKEDTLSFDQLWTAARLRAALEARPAAESPLQALRAVSKQMSAEITVDREQMRLFQELVRRHPSLAQRLLGSNEERVQAMIDALAARLGVDPARDAYPTVAVWAAGGAGQAAVRRWLQAVEMSSPAEALSVDAFIDEAFDLLERGL